MSSQEPLYSLSLASGARLAVAPICGAEQLPPDFGAGFSGTQRRLCERFSWQRLARTLLGDPTAQFSYNALGAPQIVGSPLLVSVSHSASLVAAIVAPHPCAIDIESLSRNFARVASRYISPEEEPLRAAVEHGEALLWSAKEALYKYAGIQGLNLLTDIKVASLTDSHFIATIAPHTTPIKGSLQTILDHSLVFIG